MNSEYPRDCYVEFKFSASEIDNLTASNAVVDEMLTSTVIGILSLLGNQAGPRGGSKLEYLGVECYTKFKV